MLTADDWLLVTVPLAVVLLVAARLTRRLSWGRAVGIGILVLYGLAVLSFTHFPMPTSPDYLALLRSQGETPRYLLTPLATVRAAVAEGIALREVGGNLVMLAPLGFLLPLLWPERASFLTVARRGLAVTLAIELSQLAMSTGMGVNYKTFDVDDLLLNLIGVCGGWAAWRLTNRLLASRAWWAGLHGWLLSPRPAARNRAEKLG